MDRESAGLSPSSLQLYLSCPRKYWLQKVKKEAPDPDADKDTVALRLGSAFHKVLEDCKHELSGVSLSDVVKVCLGFELDTDTAALVYAMLSHYKAVHEKSGLKAIACEVQIALPTFFGYVDVVLQAADGGWWIGDMKTASTYSPLLMPQLASHPQLSLYAAHRKVLAEALGLEVGKFLGCRYRLATKSKTQRKPGEGDAAYVGRLRKAVRAYDFAVPAAILKTAGPVQALVHASDKIAASKEKEAYPTNYGACTNYFKPCEYWSQCHGRTVSEAGEGVTFEVSE